MIDIDNNRDDWQRLGEDWRTQPTIAVDIDALRAEVRKRGRRLRVALVNEVIGFALTAALCLWVLASPQRLVAPGLIVGLLVAVFGFQCWSLWIRHQQVRDSGLDATAMVDLEIARARTSLRYWRVSVWLALAMWMALYLFTMLGGAWEAGDVVVRKLFHSLWAVGLVGVGSAFWAWGWGHRTRTRLARMLRLRDELRQD